MVENEVRNRAAADLSAIEISRLQKISSEIRVELYLTWIVLGMGALPLSWILVYHYIQLGARQAALRRGTP